MGLFSKKPGGTFFGNLFRSVASQASGGILGTGAKRIEMGQTQSNETIAKAGGVIPDSSVLQQPNSAPNPETVLTGLSKVLNQGMTQNVAVDNKTLLLVGGIVAAIVLLPKIMKK